MKNELKRTETLSEYYQARAAAIKYAFAYLADKERFSCAEFLHVVETYEKKNEIEIVSPFNGRSGGWAFAWYRRVYEMLMRRVAAGTLISGKSAHHRWFSCRLEK